MGNSRSFGARDGISRAERLRNWIELRRQGFLESDIAHRDGVTQQAVSKAILKYLRAIPRREAADLREMESERLERLWAALMPAVENGEPRAIEAAVRISERRARLFGLDAPNTHVIEGPNGGPIGVFSLPPPGAAIDVELIRRIQELDPLEKPDDYQTYLADHSRALPAPSSNEQLGHEEVFGEIAVRQPESLSDTPAATSTNRGGKF